MNSTKESGIVVQKSPYSVDETTSRFQATLLARGMKLFAIIDHSGEAQQAGLQMPNTKLLILGNAKAGTPIMLASPTAALDLPLKILISEDDKGFVWIAYNATNYLQSRHTISEELTGNIAGLANLVTAASR